MQICILEMNGLSDDMITSEQIFEATSNTFERIALQIFQFQYKHNEIYRQYCDVIRVKPQEINSFEMIPFLPIRFFKTKRVISTSFTPEIIFESSGTTGSVNSKHYIKDVSMYESGFLKTFNLFYGDIKDRCIIGLLPSYLERQHSSLVYMVNELIKRSGHPESGFYLYDTEKLYEKLLTLEKKHQPALLIGVTYALLDFAEKHQMQLKHTTVMETGGMKGRRAELTREEVHAKLKQQLGINEVHSEYGMTELLSQAYSTNSGIFNCPPWMKIVLRAEDDPFDLIFPERITGQFAGGVVNIIDLANLYSCSFIATDDIGKLYKDGSFEISGRLDNSDIRGCGLMVM